MAFDMNNLSTEDKAIAGAGVVMIIASFLPWYGVSGSTPLGSINANANGWDMGISAKLAIILAVLAAAYTVARASGVNTPDTGSAGPNTVTLGLAGLGLLFMVYRLIDLDTASAFGSSVGRKYGIFVALVASGVQAFFAFQKFRASGEKLPGQG